MSDNQCRGRRKEVLRTEACWYYPICCVLSCLYVNCTPLSFPSVRVGLLALETNIIYCLLHAFLMPELLETCNQYSKANTGIEHERPKKKAGVKFKKSHTQKKDNTPN